jgi:hypothetical protein
MTVLSLRRSVLWLNLDKDQAVGFLDRSDSQANRYLEAVPGGAGWA